MTEFWSPESLARIDAARRRTEGMRATIRAFMPREQKCSGPHFALRPARTEAATGLFDRMFGG
jgi:hypothetical protein